MRDKEEVMTRLDALISHLAHADRSQDATARLHARVLELAWVLQPYMRQAGLIEWVETPIREKEQAHERQ